MKPSILFLFASAAYAIPYSEYILAPKSRTLRPVSVHSSNGTINPEALLTTSVNTTTTTFAADAATAYDFGINIAGLVSLDIAATSDTHQAIGVTFSESSLWISNASSDATADAGKDETLWFNITGPGRYTAPREKERGGFRYMTLVHDGEGSVDVGGVDVYYTAMPHWEGEEGGLREYTGWFNCDGTLHCLPSHSTFVRYCSDILLDELLNRIFYAGAYTNQICTIDPTHGNALTHLFEINSSVSDATNVTWYYNYTITEGASALVDGAKRDRIVWAGGSYSPISLSPPNYLSYLIPFYIPFHQ
jgi:hypothetical protein